jgi:putative copper resistance protein D
VSPEVLAALPVPAAPGPGHQPGIPALASDLPPFTGQTIFTHLDLGSWLAVSLVLGAGLYLYGVLRLRQRGDHWPVLRTVLFLVPGLGSIAFVTLSGIGAYDDTLLSIHMIQHMVLGMIAPIFLALGAPVTLALRTLPPRPRKTLVRVLHSKPAKVLTFPLLAYAIFVANPFALYFTGLYHASLEHDWLHELIHLHFLITGCLFFWPLLGLDPLPGRWPYPARALLMLLSTPFHAVLGLTIMESSTLIAGDWYPNLHLTWADPHTDQVLAGGILWAGGEVVSVTMIAVLVIQWMRDADREARRVDRRLDLDRTAGRRAAAPATPAASAAAADQAQPAPVTEDEIWEKPWWERSAPG